MSFFEAALLGLVQGLTEFLPISSSAHLVFFQHLLGFKEPLLFFDVMVHVGTLLALFVYFWKDLAHLVRDSIYGLFFLLRRKPLRDIYDMAPHSRWAFGILLASVPTAVIGVLFKDWFESRFGSLRSVGYELLANSLLLWVTRYFRTGEKGIEQARWFDFLTIGTLQGVSIIPGISRSGATIAAGLFLGLKPDAAFRFSFLLSIPAIVGVAILKLPEGFRAGDWGATGVGFLVAAFSGLLSLFALSKIVSRGKLHRFAFYTLFLGLFTLYLSRTLE